MSRFKGMLGVRRSARKFESQVVEAPLKCQVLNRMAALSLPTSQRVPVY